MSAPFFKYGLFGEEMSFVWAFVIGIGFGFFLERGGFGSARKLMGQFYLNDLAVFKVMFTAILTAALGLYYLGWMGVLDLSLVYLTPTWVLPQLVGGLLLGAGFVIGGYCPGTSVVAVATGKLDGIVYVAGLFAGIFAFGEIFPLVKGFYSTTAMGVQTIPQWSGIPYGVLIFVLVLIALGGFVGAEALERRVAAKAAAGEKEA